MQQLHPEPDIVLVSERETALDSRGRLTSPKPKRLSHKSGAFRIWPSVLGVLYAKVIMRIPKGKSG